MRRRFPTSIGFATVLALVLMLEATILAQGGGATKATPRTPHGRPDLQGAWSFATITPLERPGNLADKPVLNDQEAAEFEQEAATRANQDQGRKRGTAADVNRACRPGTPATRQTTGWKAS